MVQILYGLNKDKSLALASGVPHRACTFRLTFSRVKLPLFLQDDLAFWLHQQQLTFLSQALFLGLYKY